MLAVIEIAEKECRVCHEVLPLSGFDRRRGSRDGHTTICKACHATDARERNELRKAEMLDDDGCITPGNPRVYLARAVIKFAIRDWKRKNAPRHELLLFFRSAWFEDLADLAGIDPDVVRERLGLC